MMHKTIANGHTLCMPIAVNEKSGGGGGGIAGWSGQKVSVTHVEFG